MGLKEYLLDETIKPDMVKDDGLVKFNRAWTNTIGKLLQVGINRKELAVSIDKMGNLVLTVNDNKKTTELVVDLSFSFIHSEHLGIGVK